MAKGTASPTTDELPDFIKNRDIFANGASPAPSAVVHVFPATGPQVETLELFNFNFLGKTFASNSYREIQPDGTPVIRSGAGVSKPMAKRMLRAQEEVFRLFLAQRRRGGAEANATPVSETEFNDFCDIREAHGGWGFRKGKHSFGCAVDIDVKLNPYVATRTPGLGSAPTIFGGEVDRFTAASQLPHMQEHVLKPAVEVYDRAIFMLQGNRGGAGDAKADVAHFRKGSSKSEDFAGAWRRFYFVHQALVFYFGWAFDKVPQTSQNLLNENDAHNKGVSFDVFKTRFLSSFNRGNTKDSFQNLHPDITREVKKDETGFLTRLHKQIIQDHAIVRKVMVTGNLTVADSRNAEAFKKAKAVLSRDPCYGFMSHRRETVQGLCRTTAGNLRWGACLFSERANGDIMHFDMGEGFRPAAADGLTTVTVPDGTRFEKL